MNKMSSRLTIAGLSALVLVGCGRDNPPSMDSMGARHAPDSSYVVSSEPEGAIDVGEARNSARDKQSLALVGRVGGSTKPFVDGIAAFTIVDTQVPYCADSEGCPTPWDYCCQQNSVRDNIATVKVVNAQGKPVAHDARKLLGIKELDTVVVRGMAQRDADGNLALLAEQVYVRSEK